MAEKTFYITTPIYYPSNNLHIGHSYTTVAADAVARFKRLQGYNVHFLTGTDEHGQKIQRQAEAKGEHPQAFVDGIVEGIRNLWHVLVISYDDFIRTTESRHKQAVQKIFQRFYDQGDIYKGKYRGYYCTPCEAFWTEWQLKNGNLCPDCDRPTEVVEEDAYFFRMSRYVPRLLEHIKKHPEFIQPPSRKNEMINNFLKPGLDDLCVSRTSFDWGIPVPFDPGHVIYVWLDALSNYITALGYGSEDDSLMQTFWPADVHLIGKEIVRFHTIYWPIFLMALGLPLPKRVFGHGWLLMDEGKMSKSKGNVIDPIVMADRYGSDAIRYFLLREIPFGADGVFSPQALEQRINSDLANDLGNLLHRTLNMIQKFCNGRLHPSSPREDDGELIELALATRTKMADLMDELQFSNALAVLWQLVRRSNKYIDETAPWALARDPASRDRLEGVLYNLAESIRFISVLLRPFMPRTPEKIWEQLGIAGKPELQTWASLDQWGGIPAGTAINKGKPLFPRIGAVYGQKTKKEKPQPCCQKKDGREEVTIDDFAKLDLRVAEILSAEPVKGTDHLLKLQVSLGDENRQVVAGLAKHFTPEQLIGQKVIMVANLKPVKLKGELSQGMILAASDDEGRLALTGISNDLPSGSKVK